MSIPSAYPGLSYYCCLLAPFGRAFTVDLILHRLESVPHLMEVVQPFGRGPFQGRNLIVQGFVLLVVSLERSCFLHEIV